MNRAEKRKIIRTIPGYKKALKSATEKVVDDLEMMFRRNWEDDETLNNGERNYDDDGEDDIYND